MNNKNLRDTSNSYCFVFITEELKLEILGGIRIDILDRMRRKQQGVSVGVGAQQKAGKTTVTTIVEININF